MDWAGCQLRDTEMPTAVLLSGGLDSAVLLAEEAARADVQPIYVSVGLAWEPAERDMVGRFLAAIGSTFHLRPLVSLSIDMRDVYPSTHWALVGQPPAYHTPDEDVYLPGRNVVLLGKAGVFCAMARIGRLVLGTLHHNPFPDATPEFRTAMADALSKGLGWRLDIDAPYARVSKADVIHRGAALGLPLELTLSCMNPVAGPPATAPERSGAARHCGLCSKCRERHDAFLQAGLGDPTEYVDSRYVRS
jgi:7-cyano-7-deazaguanine synthase